MLCGGFPISLRFKTPLFAGLLGSVSSSQQPEGCWNSCSPQPNCSQTCSLGIVATEQKNYMCLNSNYVQAVDVSNLIS